MAPSRAAATGKGHGSSALVLAAGLVAAAAAADCRGEAGGCSGVRFFEQDAADDRVVLLQVHSSMARAVDVQVAGKAAAPQERLPDANATSSAPPALLESYVRATSQGLAAAAVYPRWAHRHPFVHPWREWMINATGEAKAAGGHVHMVKHFFGSAGTDEWVALLLTCCGLLLLDYLVLQRLKDFRFFHFGMVVFWVAAAMAFNFGVLLRRGEADAAEWFLGYVLDWMLSVDNTVFFHMVFLAFAVPRAQIHKALFIGIPFALTLRLFNYMVIDSLMQVFSWLRIPVGLLLIWSGFSATRTEEDDSGDARETLSVRACQWFLGPYLAKGYDTGHLVTWTEGRPRLTLLFLVVAVVELTDGFFQLDCITLKVHELKVPYLAFSSSALAIFGARDMYFLIMALVEMFSLLRFGLALILMFVGAELLAGSAMQLSAAHECSAIVGIVILSALASVVKDHFEVDVPAS